MELSGSEWTIYEKKMKNNLNRKNVFYFWALFDLLYIIRFIWLNLEQGRIPLVDDILSFNSIFPQHGSYSLILFSLSLLLNISIVFSAIYLFRQKSNVRWLIYIQTPLRIIFITPSLSFLPWLLKTLSIKSAAIFLLATVLSEILKVVTIYLTKKTATNNHVLSIDDREKKDEQ